MFSSSFWTIGLGRAKNLEKNRKKTKKKQFCRDLPKILLTGLFFFGFFGFLRVFGQLGLGEQKTSRKTKKKTILHGLTQDSSHRMFFCFFWFSSSFWTIGLGRAKNLEKNKKKQFCMDLPKILPTGLVFLFFWFSLSFWTFGKLGMEKKGKNKTCKNPTLPAWLSVSLCALGRALVVIYIIFMRSRSRTRGTKTPLLKLYKFTNLEDSYRVYKLRTTRL